VTLHRRTLIATAAAALPSLAACRGDASHRLIGAKLPDAALVRAGAAGRLNPARTGKPAIIRFWGLWCPVCRRDEALWQDAVRQLRGRDNLAMFTVHSGPAPGSGPSIADWAMAQAEDVALPVLDDSARSYTQALGVPGVPLVVLADRQGQVFDTNWAMGSARGMRSFVRRAIYQLDRLD
jgi:thiol-disulfide isomerase/thioredoxin